MESSASELKFAYDFAIHDHTTDCWKTDKLMSITPIRILEAFELKYRRII